MKRLIILLHLSLLGSNENVIEKPKWIHVANLKRNRDQVDALREIYPGNVFLDNLSTICTAAIKETSKKIVDDIKKDIAEETDCSKRYGDEFIRNSKAFIEEGKPMYNLLCELVISGFAYINYLRASNDKELEEKKRKILCILNSRQRDWKDICDENSKYMDKYMKELSSAEKECKAKLLEVLFCELYMQDAKDEEYKKARLKVLNIRKEMAKVEEHALKNVRLHKDLVRATALGFDMYMDFAN